MIRAVIHPGTPAPALDALAREILRLPAGDLARFGACVAERLPLAPSGDDVWRALAAAALELRKQLALERVA